jgi:N-acetylglucosaminyldiphosphoundecaprenol N-acetyl-beta-D-mannosaminyltransferase
LVEEINASGADIVWVGLGSPMQERWMAEHIGRLRASVLIGVGAAFDFHAGLKRQAPSWMQRAGLEWSFRLAMEPRRLWRRYLIRNSQFIWLMFLQAIGRRRVPLDI